MWKVRAGVQGSKRKFHTHIHLDYARIEILSYIKKKIIWYYYYYYYYYSHTYDPFLTWTQLAWSEPTNLPSLLICEYECTTMVGYCEKKANSKWFYHTFFFGGGKDRWGIINLLVNQPLQRKSSLEEHPSSK